MKKQKKKNGHGRHGDHTHRNAAPPAPRAAPKRRRIPLPPIPDPPDWKTVAASVIGGGGTALLGGYLANRGWDPQMVGLAMTTSGAVGAFALPGPWRVAANGVAAAGAGQLALATMHKAAVSKAVKEAVAVGTPKRNALGPAFGDALGSAMYGDTGPSYGSSIDDEERMLDPDLVLQAA